jgi:hypothetical protein
MTETRQELESSLRCPRCGGARPGKEWRRVFRFVRSGNGLSPITVLRHTACNEIVYFSLAD